MLRGIGLLARVVVTVAPGQAPRIAACTPPAGTVPGTQHEIESRRPAQLYCHTTCGVPYSRRRHRDGVKVPYRLAHNAAAPAGSTCGGGAMVTSRASRACRRCRHRPAPWRATITAVAATRASG